MISVIIPAYNEEEYIGECLSALKNCKTNDYEIIIVDGKSTDRTVEICRSYTDRIIIEEEKEGIGPARNKGAAQAKGEIVAFLDADSIPCEGWLDIIQESFTHGIDALGGPTFYGRLKYDLFSRAVFLVNNITKLRGLIYLSGNNSAYRKDLFFEIGGFKKVVCEDLDLSRDLSKKGAKITFNPAMKVLLSPRRFEKKGFLRTVALWGYANILILTGKRMGTEKYGKV